MPRDLADARTRGQRSHGRLLGAAIGLALGLAAAFAVHAVVRGDSSGIFAFPATLATALFVGLMGGLMFGSIVAGGREDDRATAEAEQAIRAARAGHRSCSAGAPGDAGP